MPIKNPYGNLILMLAPLFRCYVTACTIRAARSRERSTSSRSEQAAAPARTGISPSYFARLARRYYRGDTYLFDYHMLPSATILRAEHPGARFPGHQGPRRKTVSTVTWAARSLRCFWPTRSGHEGHRRNALERAPPLSHHPPRTSRRMVQRRRHHRRRRAHRNVPGRPICSFKPAPVAGASARSRQQLGRIAADVREAGAKQSEPPAIRRRLGFLAAHADYLADQLLLSREPTGRRPTSKLRSTGCGRFLKTDQGRRACDRCPVFRPPLPGPPLRNPRLWVDLPQSVAGEVKGTDRVAGSSPTGR